MSTLFAYFLFVIAQIIIAFNEMFFFSQNIFIFFLFFHKIYVLVIPWFVRMYNAIMHSLTLVHFRMYMQRTMV